MVDRVRVDRFTWERLVLSSRLPRPCRDVLMVLAVFMSHDGGRARPGLDNLAVAAGRSRSVVSEHLATAVTAGYLTQLTRGGKRQGGGGMASEYAATVPGDMWERAEAILGALPWRNPATSTSGQQDVDPQSTSGLQDVDLATQRPASRMLTDSTSGAPDVDLGTQRPASRMLTGGQRPVFGSQRPASRTPSRSYTPRTSVETDVHPSPTAVSEISPVGLPNATSPGARDAPTPIDLPDELRTEPRCSRHRGDPDPPPCGACARARQEADAAAEAAQLAADRRARAERRARAAATAAAIAACPLCDDHGWRGTTTCTHDPGDDDRRARGIAAARAALARPEPDQQDPEARSA